MTQEEKQLLLQDLCARLPYQPLCKKVDTEDDFCEYDGLLGYSLRDLVNNKIIIKPYLRPMSSMAEEEREFLKKMALENSLKCIKEEDPRKIFSLSVKHDAEELAYLYKHHYDVLGLIPAGLAISTETFNPYKN